MEIRLRCWTAATAHHLPVPEEIVCHLLEQPQERALNGDAEAEVHLAVLEDVDGCVFLVFQAAEEAVRQIGGRAGCNGEVVGGVWEGGAEELAQQYGDRHPRFLPNAGEGEAKQRLAAVAAGRDALHQHLASVFEVIVAGQGEVTVGFNRDVGRTGDQLDARDAANAAHAGIRFKALDAAAAELPVAFPSGKVVGGALDEHPFLTGNGADFVVLAGEGEMLPGQEGLVDMAEQPAAEGFDGAVPLFGEVVGAAQKAHDLLRKGGGVDGKEAAAYHPRAVLRELPPLLRADGAGVLFQREIAGDEGRQPVNGCGAAGLAAGVAGAAEQTRDFFLRNRAFGQEDEQVDGGVAGSGGIVGGNGGEGFRVGGEDLAVRAHVVAEQVPPRQHMDKGPAGRAGQKLTGDFKEVVKFILDNGKKLLPPLLPPEGGDEGEGRLDRLLGGWQPGIGADRLMVLPGKPAEVEERDPVRADPAQAGDLVFHRDGGQLSAEAEVAGDAAQDPLAGGAVGAPEHRRGHPGGCFGRDDLGHAHPEQVGEGVEKAVLVAVAGGADGLGAAPVEQHPQPDLPGGRKAGGLGQEDKGDGRQEAALPFEEGLVIKLGRGEDGGVKFRFAQRPHPPEAGDVGHRVQAFPQPGHHFSGRVGPAGDQQHLAAPDQRPAEGKGEVGGQIAVKRVGVEDASALKEKPGRPHPSLLEGDAAFKEVAEIMAEGALLRVRALLQLLEIAGGGFRRILPLGQVVAEEAVGEELPVQAAELLKAAGDPGMLPHPENFVLVFGQGQAAEKICDFRQNQDGNDGVDRVAEGRKAVKAHRAGEDEQSRGRCPAEEKAGKAAQLAEGGFQNRDAVLLAFLVKPPRGRFIEGLEAAGEPAERAAEDELAERVKKQHQHRRQVGKAEGEREIQQRREDPRQQLGRKDNEEGELVGQQDGGQAVKQGKSRQQHLTVPLRAGKVCGQRQQAGCAQQNGEQKLEPVSRAHPRSPPRG